MREIVRLNCPACGESIPTLTSRTATTVRCPACDELLQLAGGDGANSPGPRDAQAGSQSLRLRQVAAARASTGEAAVQSPIATHGGRRVGLVKGARIGRFALRALLGRGSFGQVWRAYDESLDREVALKFPRFDDEHTDETDRFFREARAAAQLRHPNIVAVHDTGQADGYPYIAMELIDGMSLSQWLKDNKPNTRRACDLIRKLAEALHYAHSHGIFHRDIKPSNVLLDTRGEPHLTDFGLARRLEREATMTADGAILGTPGYMAPEQATGRAHLADARSDLYSLGVMLFELLAGRKPFDGTVHAVLHQVIHHDPPPLRALDPKASRDLETICAKCLAKEPDRRYPSAQHLADDLNRWLRNEPITARRVRFHERAWRWCRRNPAIAGTLSASIVLVLTIAAVSFVRISAERDFALEQKHLAEQREHQSNLELYASDVRLAFDAWGEGRVSRVIELLEKHTPKENQDDLRGFEWHYLARLCHREKLSLPQHSTAIEGLAFSPDGSLLATASDRVVKLWDPRNGSLVKSHEAHRGTIHALAFSPDGTVLATGAETPENDGEVFFWNVPSWERMDEIDTRSGVLTIAFSPDGKTLATGGGKAGPTTKRGDELILWDFPTKEEKVSHEGQSTGVVAAAFSSDGKLLATASRNLTGSGGGAYIWDASSGELRVKLRGHAYGHALSLAFAPDGKSLATGSEDFTVKTWNVETAEQENSIEAGVGSVLAIACCPSTELLAVAGGNGIVRFMDSKTGELRATLQGHTAPVQRLCFSPGGDSLATGSQDGSVRIWDTSEFTRPVNFTPPTWNPELKLRTRDDTLWGVTTLTGHQHEVAYLAFSHDARMLTAGKGRIWNVVDRVAVELSEEAGSELAFSPDGRTVAFNRKDQSSAVVLCDISTKQTVRSLNSQARGVTAMTFSPNGQILATSIPGDTEGAIILWDVSSGGEIRRHPTTMWNIGRVCFPVFSPDGNVLAAAGKDSTELWNVTNGELIAALAPVSTYVRNVSFSPDGRILALGGQQLAENAGFGIRLFDSANFEEIAAWASGRTWAIAFSPDGKTLVSGGQDSVTWWHVATRRELAVHKIHSDAVYAVAFSPDGKTLATAGRDMTVRLWRIAD